MALTPPRSVSLLSRTEPIRRCPVVGGLTGPDRSRLQTDNRFAAHPVAAGIERVPCDDKHVGAIAGNAAVTPNTAAHGCCSPAMHIGRIVDVHADNPAMIIAAVPQVSGVGRRTRSRSPRASAPRSSCTREIECNSVVHGRGVHIHRPAGIRGTGVHVQRINEMLDGMSQLINASKKSDREARSTTGVPVMPAGLMFPHG